MGAGEELHVGLDASGDRPTRPCLDQGIGCTTPELERRRIILSHNGRAKKSTLGVESVPAGRSARHGTTHTYQYTHDTIACGDSQT